jgi:hypothetical protein
MFVFPFELVSSQLPLKFQPCGSNDNTSIIFSQTVRIEKVTTKKINTIDDLLYLLAVTSA